MKALTLAFLSVLLDMAAQIAFLLWLFMGIPWLYAHYGSESDWWVFFLAVSVFTAPFLFMLWFPVRRRQRADKKGRAEEGFMGSVEGPAQSG